MKNSDLYVFSFSKLTSLPIAFHRFPLNSRHFVYTRFYVYCESESVVCIRTSVNRDAGTSTKTFDIIFLRLKNARQYAINNNNCQFRVSAVESSIITSYFAIRVTSYIESIISAIFAARKLVAIPVWFTTARAPECAGKWLNHRVSNSFAIVSPLSANPPRVAARLLSMTWQFCVRTTGQPYEILS